MNIVGICGSLKAESANLDLLRRARELAPSGVQLSIYEGLGTLPFFNPDLEGEGALAPVVAFRRVLTEAHGLLIASPEYGHSLPGVLKNAIDWVVGSGELYGKAVAVTAAAPGPGRGERGLKALCTTLAAVGARIIGGDPIVKGPDADAELTVLLEALLAVAHRAPA